MTSQPDPTGIKQLRPFLPPSGVRAEKPVAWRYRMRSSFDAEFVSGWSFAETDPGIPNHLPHDTEPLFAAPPVRGDRESIARAAYEADPDLQCWKGAGEPNYSWDEVRAMGQDYSLPFYRIADAILSLPSAPVSDDPLADLVMRFSTALLGKLRYARDVKGRSGWEQSHWAQDCQRALLDHIPKGDPLDVAAYTAFCWHHGWSTALSEKCPQCHGEGVLQPDGCGCEKCGGSGKVPPAPVSGRDAAIEASWRTDIESAPKDDVLFMLRQNRTACVACWEIRADHSGVWLDESDTQIFPIAWMLIRALSNHKESGR